MTFHGVDDWQPRRAKTADQPADSRHNRGKPFHVIAGFAKTTRPMKPRCMSMTMSAVVARSKRKGKGAARSPPSMVTCHVAADHRDIRALARRLMGDRPSDDEDAVGELQNFVEVLADEEQRGAAVPRRDDARTDFRHR
jgi:hypothetical protein